MELVPKAGSVCIMTFCVEAGSRCYPLAILREDWLTQVLLLNCTSFKNTLASMRSECNTICMGAS